MSIIERIKELLNPKKEEVEVELTQFYLCPICVNHIPKTDMYNKIYHQDFCTFSEK